MLNKLFGKKDQNKNYFLEIEEKPEVKAETKEVVAETKVDTVATKKSEPKTTIKTESKSPTKTVSKIATPDQPEWVKAIKNYSDVKAEENKENPTFSTTYLLTNTPLIRRRPGPSLNQFKAMVNTMKIKTK
jgi:hypothetical protein